MATYVSLNSAGYVLIETQSADVPSWAGDDRLVASFTENKIDSQVLGYLLIRPWREGDGKRTRSRLHYNEKTQSWNTSLKCSMGNIQPFGKTLIPNDNIRIRDGDLLIDLPRVLNPIIAKPRKSREEVKVEGRLWEMPTPEGGTMPTRDYAIGSDHLPGLSKLIEEAGEVIQAGGKILGAGTMGLHWDGSELNHRLEEEIGDFFAAAEFFTKHNHLNRQTIRQRAEDKLKTFERWHHNIQEGRDPNDDG